MIQSVQRASGAMQHCYQKLCRLRRLGHDCNCQCKECLPAREFLLSRKGGIELLNTHEQAQMLYVEWR